MTKNYFLLLVFVLVNIKLFAQFDFGLKIGYNYNMVHVVANESQLGEIASQNKSGFNITPFFRLKEPKTGLYVQTEPTFTKYNTGFGVTLNNHLKYNEIESNRFDLTLLAGIKLGAVRFFGGAVPSWNLKSVSSILDYELATLNTNKFAIGYKAGIGFELQRLIIDIAYEAGINHVLGMTYAGKDLGRLNNSGDQIIVSFGLRF